MVAENIKKTVENIVETTQTNVNQITKKVQHKNNNPGEKRLHEVHAFKENTLKKTSEKRELLFADEILALKSLGSLDNDTQWAQLLSITEILTEKAISNEHIGVKIPKLTEHQVLALKTFGYTVEEDGEQHIISVTE